MADASHAQPALNLAEHWPAVQVVVPMLAAVLVATVRNGRVAWLLTLATAWLMLVVSFLMLGKVSSGGTISYMMGGWERPLGIEYRVDYAGAFLALLISIAAAVVLPYARLSAERDIPEEKRAWFFSMFLICMCGLYGMVLTGDAFNAFVFIEISSLSTYAMIAMGHDRRALLAAFQYLIIGTVGATLFVIGVGLLYVMTGTLNMVDLAQRLDDVSSIRPILAGIAFITVGLSLKIALFPLHSWLPNAYAYAPSVATVFLASTATKVAIYLLARFFLTVFGREDESEYNIDLFFIGLSLAAMFGASFVACFQKNVERMLAYSSVAQIGYITLGIAFATQTGLTGSMVHLLNHALMKGALFMGTGIIMYRLASVKLDDLGGIGRAMPITMAGFTLAGLSLIGVPGTVGFVSKWYLALAAFELEQGWLAFAIMLSSLLAVIYVGRIVEVAYFRSPTMRVQKLAKEAPLSMMIPMWLLVAACVYFGLDGSLTAGTAELAAKDLLAGVR